MQPDSNQLYGTTKFETLEDITVANLKFQPIIDYTGKFTYNAVKVTADYLRPLCKMNIPSMANKNFQFL